MDRLGYIAMTGATHTMRAQAVVSNNLANISTTGFRAELVAADSAPIYGDVHPSRVNVVTAGYGADFSAGAIMPTGRDLDVAINGEGFIGVQAPDGQEAYTRAGDFYIDTLGMLKTANGLPVMGDGGPVAVPPNSSLTIGADGTISVVPLGQPSNALAIVDRIRLVNPPTQELARGRDGLFRMKGGETAEADASVTLVTGSLETSNVNASAALVEMIELSRTYEMQIKTIETARDDADRAAQLMRLS
ncbi:MAG: flagellar basal-body rod protein FlgF [Pseudomonadota bacterium]